MNDARLIAKTLDSLNFDVILKENLGSDTDFKKAVFEFGKKEKITMWLSCIMQDTVFKLIT